MGQIKKIAIEEHFNAVGFEDYSKSFVALIDNANAQELQKKLTDFDELRLAEMDKVGLDYVILSQTGPGVQVEKDVATAIRRAKENNDFLAERIQRHPTRFGGFATLPMQDPAAAVAELERTVKEYGFKGALVNGHTHGVYYDAPEYDVLWAKLQELDVPLYLHPFDSYDEPHFYKGHSELTGATWGWGVETATHALRILFAGVFDRFPNVKLILGHMGEGLPFQRWRFDSRFAVYPQGVTLQHPPSTYIGRNILITTSGVCSEPTLLGAIGEMGAESVLFSVDYPYESTDIAAEFIEKANLSPEVKELVCHKNAERIFKL